MSEREPSLPPTKRAITEVDEARALAARLQRADVLALDTEGDGMFRYRSRLCTLQLASTEELAVVDTLVVDPAVFATQLADRAIEKIVHDAAFDARLLVAHGVPLGSVFDTAVAARFLGFSATGLASLLASLFDVHLPKHMQQADWGSRPLDEDQIAYLENDVRYLIPLRAALLERARADDIEPEIREECAYVLHEAERSAGEPSPFSRVKGALGRPAKERARLYELAHVRDALARELDEPVARVVANDLLLRLAQLEQPSQEELERRLATRYRLHAALFSEALARAETRSDAPPEELASLGPMPPVSELARRKRRRELLTALRTREATARGVDAQVVLPGHCVNDMVKLDRFDRASIAEVPGFGACRSERYGERWERELTGRW